MNLNDEIVAVWPLAGFDKTLHYKAAEGMSQQIAVGTLVRVPTLSWRRTLSPLSMERASCFLNVPSSAHFEHMLSSVLAKSRAGGRFDILF